MSVKVNKKWLDFKMWFENKILEKNLNTKEYNLAEFSFKEGYKRAIEETTITFIDDESCLLINENKFKCNKCEEIFIVIKGVFKYCPNCGRKIVYED